MIDGGSRDQIEAAVFSLLERSFRQLGLSDGDDQKIRQLTELTILLASWAQRINLTGHRDPLELTSRLILDAVALSATLPEIAELSSLADLGSGAGFPGLPIAIMNPHLEVRLVESRLKRNHFQREACRRLKLAHVEPVLGRSEKLVPVESDIVVAQAMTQPERAIELMIPWASLGGLIILPASAGTSAPRVPPHLEPFEKRSYVVPEVEIQRTIWVGRLRS